MKNIKTYKAEYFNCIYVIVFAYDDLQALLKAKNYSIFHGSILHLYELDVDENVLRTVF